MRVVRLTAQVTCELCWRLGETYGIAQLKSRGPAAKPILFRIGGKGPAADHCTSQEASKQVAQCSPVPGAGGRPRVIPVDRSQLSWQMLETEGAKAIYRQRGAVAEFPNAWLKDKLGLRQFRLRGLIKVRLEILWAALTYNIQQWIRLSWRTKLALANN